MTAILTASRNSLSDLVTRMKRVNHRLDHEAKLIADLRRSSLTPACFVPGIEHHAAAAIIRAGLPAIEHHRRPLQPRIDEHLFLDVAARTGVRILACWDDRAHRVRMQVAEVGEPDLWDRIVVLFTQWEMNGRPVPVTTRTHGSAS
ncbi:Uncharacterised protein [Amycolatopsis camponoti]|uniref:Uncharacterized protein n=1 Tax=Amycolatopsis camponoti TaxID=2606593 RepID=A0A6I8M4R2_9PSEU|nr:hypothetical protein [Amycolatopsis camponoti]VVJ22640.1 Uncharacterised protein [Amycolatopsis camponoti]